MWFDLGDRLNVNQFRHKVKHIICMIINIKELILNNYKLQDIRVSERYFDFIFIDYKTRKLKIKLKTDEIGF